MSSTNVFALRQEQTAKFPSSGVEIPEAPKQKQVRRRAKKQFVCHLCGAVMHFSSKYRHLASAHNVFLSEKHPCEVSGSGRTSGGAPRGRKSGAALAGLLRKLVARLQRCIFKCCIFQ